MTEPTLTLKLAAIYYTALEIAIGNVEDTLERELDEDEDNALDKLDEDEDNFELDDDRFELLDDSPLED